MTYLTNAEAYRFNTRGDVATGRRSEADLAIARPDALLPDFRDLPRTVGLLQDLAGLAP